MGDKAWRGVPGIRALPTKSGRREARLSGQSDHSDPSNPPNSTSPMNASSPSSPSSPSSQCARGPRPCAPALPLCARSPNCGRLPQPVRRSGAVGASRRQAPGPMGAAPRHSGRPAGERRGGCRPDVRRAWSACCLDAPAIILRFACGSDGPRSLPKRSWKRPRTVRGYMRWGYQAVEAGRFRRCWSLAYIEPRGVDRTDVVGRGRHDRLDGGRAASIRPSASVMPKRGINI